MDVVEKLLILCSLDPLLTLTSHLVNTLIMPLLDSVVHNRCRAVHLMESDTWCCAVPG